MASNPPPNTPDLAAFLGRWFRAWQAAKLYGADHPVMHHAAQEAAQAIAGLSKVHTVVVLPEGFECDGVAVENNPPSEAHRTLAESLHQIDISSIVISPGLTADDVASAAMAFSQGSEAETPLADRVNEASSGRFVLRSITYRDVKVHSGPRANNDLAEATDRDQLWSRLNTGILNPNAEATDPRFLTKLIGSEITSRPHAAMKNLRNQLVQSARTLAQRPAEEQTAGLDQMGRLLADLGPQLQASLQEAIAGSSHNNPPDTPPHAKDDSVATSVAQALHRGEKAGAQLSTEALMLCQKLAQLRPDGHASDNLASRVAPNTNANNTDDANPADTLADALESIFSRYDPTEFTPDDYQSQIRSTLDVAIKSKQWAHLEHTFSTNALGVHCAKVANHLLLESLDSKGNPLAPSPVLQQYIADSIERLIEARSFNILFDRIQSNDPVFSQALTQPNIIDSILHADACDEQGENISILTDLLQRGGPQALDHVTRRIIDDTDFSIGQAAAKLITTTDITLRCGALYHALAQSPCPLPQKAQTLFKDMGFKTTIDVIKTRLTNQDPTQRCAAYQLLAAAHPQWPAHFISRALRDKEPSVQTCVINQLIAGRNAQHLDLTKVVLEGISSAGLLPTETFNRLAQAVLSRGPEGEKIAAHVLKSLAYTFSPSRAAMATQLAKQLAAHDTHPAVHKALRAWRMTPARLVARFNITSKKTNSLSTPNPTDPNREAA